MKKTPITIDPGIYVCITLLAIAVQPNIKNDIKELIEPMMATEINSTLTIILKELVVTIPELKNDITHGKKKI